MEDCSTTIWISAQREHWHIATQFNYVHAATTIKNMIYNWHWGWHIWHAKPVIKVDSSEIFNCLQSSKCFAALIGKLRIELYLTSTSGMRMVLLALNWWVLRSAGHRIPRDMVYGVVQEILYSKDISSWGEAETVVEWKQSRHDQSAFGIVVSTNYCGSCKMVCNCITVLVGIQLNGSCS